MKVTAENKQTDSTGDRTQNLWFRRPAPYPLGHGVLLLMANMPVEDSRNESAMSPITEEDTGHVAEGALILHRSTAFLSPLLTSSESGNNAKLDKAK
ncbi:hypothetical protein NC653_013239 [Populus alba x Populus x berolinensis]|uniref:Uncharacterized protein n=1 Tax=Populus alba x Populus x berolinensis TaxID=444605 RepID=A0AAD6W2D0_9ROSI|nr:hypothetical protein NC653_013239 [Populus alba x Populus x berolinensis]